MRSRRRHHRRKRCIKRDARSWYRLPEEGKIAGVCAGFAEYYEISNLMARGIAVTGAVFMPQIVIIAYIVAIFLLPTRQELRRETHDSVLDDVESRSERRERRRRKMEEALDEAEDAEYEQSLSTRRMMVRRYKERMASLDERMQNLERHVTSRRYDLSQEIDSL